MTSDLRFPMGGSSQLADDVVEDFLGIAGRVTGDMSRKRIVETFKEYFSRAIGKQHYESSSLDWAESDLRSDAMRAAEDAPGFIAAFCDACEKLEDFGVAVPDHARINNILSNKNAPFRIKDNVLLMTSDHVPAPDPKLSEAQSVARALTDAKELSSQGKPSSAVDRAHTALHGYLIWLCEGIEIELDNNLTVSKAFKELRANHPALQPTGERADDITRLLMAMATAIDALSPIRNKASLAHSNRLLEEAEGLAVLNAVYTIFHYIQDCLARHS